MNDRIEEIKARREKHSGIAYVDVTQGVDEFPVYISHDSKAATDIDYLLAEVERLRAENAALKAENQRWRWRSYPNNPELPG